MKKLLFTILCFCIMHATFTMDVVTTTPTPSYSETDAVISNAIQSFKAQSKKERKQKLKLVKDEIKNFKKLKAQQAEPSTNTLLLAILAILLPPLAVYLHEGTANSKFWLSLILSLLFWVPGVIYALIVVLG